ncbi:MAG TPA: tyrosine-type recombinase/integrase [Burkholderiales bacterium]|nr:tyrosine-type recombinase/integrase [Burkholderiales bacterium]
MTTVNDILDRFVREYIPERLAPRTQRDYLRHVGHLRLAFGTRIADELRPRDFGPFLDVRKGKVQRVRQLAVLSAAFSEAVGTWYMIERNVLRDVKRPRSKPRDRLISDEEFASLHAAAPLRVRLAMELALLTGQRQGDIIGLKWDQIREMEIHIEQAKTGKRLAIEVTPALEAVLDRCWALPDRGEFVLTRRCGGRYTSEGFRALWQRTMRQWVRRGGIRFTFHDIRALCATKCATMEAAMHLLGHSNISMTRRVYRRGIERVKPLELKAA